MKEIKVEIVVETSDFDENSIVGYIIGCIEDMAGDDNIEVISGRVVD